MSPDVVVDIGNSRVKWGRCENHRIVEFVTLAHDAEDWARQLHAWSHQASNTWAIAGVKPSTQLQFVEWLTQRGQRAFEIRDHRQIPLHVSVDHPEQVGIDRLLSALAAYWQAKHTPSVVINVGTAITIDLIDETGTYRGGAIMPGPQLMALSLYEHTAKLPLVELSQNISSQFPGRSTRSAIQSGIIASTCGAIRLLVEEYSKSLEHLHRIVITGGGAQWILQFTDFINRGSNIDWSYDPLLTLEGIRLSAEELSSCPLK